MEILLFIALIVSLLGNFGLSYLLYRFSLDMVDSPRKKHQRDMEVTKMMTTPEMNEDFDTMDNIDDEILKTAIKKRLKGESDITDLGDGEVEPTIYDQI